MNKTTIINEFDSTIQNAVNNAYPSIFTKDDVILLLRDLQDTLVGYADENNGGVVSAAGLTDEQVKSLTTAITDAICGHGDTQSLISDYDLSMHYREVEIDSISFDDGNIEDVVQYGINEWLENNTNK